MRTFSPEMQAALEGPATTLAECWRVTRKDGVVLGFTDHDENLEFAGTVFEARSGLTASEAESELGLASESREVSGALSSARIEEDDIAAGRFDGAVVETFLVDWSDPTAAHAVTDVQTVGEIVRGDLAFTVELRSRMADLDRVRGRLYRRECDAAFGDGRCTIDLGARGFRQSGAVIARGDRFVTVAVGGNASPSSYRHGRVAFEAGAAKGVAREIVDAERLADGSLQLVLTAPLAVLPQVGDSAVVTEGCDKRFTTCRNRFGNSLNFRGFPHLPGSDVMLGVAKSDQVHDGRSLVR